MNQKITSMRAPPVTVKQVTPAAMVHGWCLKPIFHNGFKQTKQQLNDAFSNYI
jgi:hypothetical protein